MFESLLVSQTLLWAIVVVLALVCLVLARQVGVLYERIAPAGALAMNGRLSGGDVAPALPLTTLSGDSISIGSGVRPGQHRSQLLFFLSPSCPVCKALLPVLKSIGRRESRELDIILASDGDDPDRHRRFVERAGLEEFPYVISETLGLAYGVGRLPYAVLINGDGRIAALGIVNTREHLESLFEAQALGQATIQEYLRGRAAANAHDERARHEPV
jgi:methylamine dehydrogenase accessory protein MauD